MYWWLYITIGFFVGAFAGGLLTRLFYFPKRVGRLIVVSDPDEPTNPDKQMVFMEAIENPDQLRHRDLVSIQIVDKTKR